MSIEAMKLVKTMLQTGMPEYDLNDAIQVLDEAIEAAEKQKPVQTTGETNVELDFYPDATGNGQQRQLVGEVEMGQLVGDGPHKSAGNPDAEGAVAVIRGVDEHGPMLGWYKHWINFPVGTQCYTTPPAASNVAPPRVREPVAIVRTWHKNGDQHAELEDWGLGLFKLPDGEHTLYTTPPAAQRQWVGLTDEEKLGLIPAADGSAEADAKRVEVLPGVWGSEFSEVDAWSMPLVLQILCAHEAKLREKNGGQA